MGRYDNVEVISQNVYCRQAISAVVANFLDAFFDGSALSCVKHNGTLRHVLTHDAFQLFILGTTVASMCGGAVPVDA